jgi:hypothetical protein
MSDGLILISKLDNDAYQRSLMHPFANQGRFSGCDYEKGTLCNLGRKCTFPRAETGARLFKKRTKKGSFQGFNLLARLVMIYALALADLVVGLIFVLFFCKRAMPKKK